MKTVYLDFDGTIIDSSARLYEAYKSIITEFGYPYLSKDEYWSLKRERQPYDFILAKTHRDVNVAEFMNKFIERVELPEFLKFDKLIDGAYKSLTAIKKDNRLILVTLRRSKDNLYRELKDLGIFDLFDDIFADFKEGVNSWKVTAESIRKDPKFNAHNSVIVGDTEDTTLSGNDLGIKGVQVLSGIRSRDILEQYNPDCILNDINELPNCLLELIKKKND